MITEKQYLEAQKKIDKKRLEIRKYKQIMKEFRKQINIIHLRNTNYEKQRLIELDLSVRLYNLFTSNSLFVLEDLKHKSLQYYKNKRGVGKILLLEVKKLYKMLDIELPNS